MNLSIFFHRIFKRKYSFLSIFFNIIFPDNIYAQQTKIPVSSAWTVEVTQDASVVPRRNLANIGTPFQQPHTTRRETVGVFYPPPSREETVSVFCPLPTGGEGVCAVELSTQSDAGCKKRKLISRRAFQCGHAKEENISNINISPNKYNEQ